MAAYFCHTCLRKPKKREAKISPICPRCKQEYLAVKNSRVRKRAVARLARLRGIKPPSRKREYDRYLKSPEWLEIRLRILIRDSGSCQDCGGKATQVHHLSYSPAVMAGQDDSNLVSLCRECHKKRHPKKRRPRRVAKSPRMANGDAAAGRAYA